MAKDLRRSRLSHLPIAANCRDDSVVLNPSGASTVAPVFVIQGEGRSEVLYHPVVVFPGNNLQSCVASVG